MTGRTVLITGATSGIGRATAMGLARMGASLAITGRDRVRTGDAAGEIRAAGGGQVDVFVADLSSQSSERSYDQARGGAALADQRRSRRRLVQVLVEEW